MDEGMTAFEELQTEQRLDIEGLEEGDDKLAAAFKQDAGGALIQTTDRDPPCDRLVAALVRLVEFAPFRGGRDR